MVGGYRQFGSRAVLFGPLLLSGLFQSALADNDTVPFSTYSTGSGNDKVVVAVNVPEGAQNSDLYFHFEAPANGVSWAGFGMGSGMAGSLMFVVYRPSDNSQEPTISPRIATGHIMPLLTEAVNVTLLEGSQITADRFVANFHCHNCRSWDGGEVDVTSDSAPFIYALGPNGDLTSNDKSVTISQHSSYHSGWSQNMKQATGTNGVPLVNGSGSSSSGSSGSSGNTNSGSGSSDDSSTAEMTAGKILHGVVMCLAFALIYPLGYLFLRLSENVMMHAGFQTFGVVLTIVGVIAGILVSKRESINPDMNHPHQIIGLVTFVLVFLTWTLGLIGHAQYKKTKTPSPLMKGHKILGPLGLALGFANACIGFAWVGLRRPLIGYVVVSVIIWVVISVLVFMKSKKNMRRGAATNSAAAVNFREGQPGGNVAMQNMDGGHGRVEYYNVHADK